MWVAAWTVLCASVGCLVLNGYVGVGLLKNIGHVVGVLGGRLVLLGCWLGRAVLTGVYVCLLAAVGCCLSLRLVLVAVVI